MMSEKEQWLGMWNREFPTTLKVLKAFPAEKGDWKPHDKSRTARELAWTLVSEEILFGSGAFTGTIDFSNAPSAPTTYAEVIAGYEKSNAELVAKAMAASEEELQMKMPFPSGPNKMGEIRRIDLLWMMLLDSIHHRGQFSVYVRQAGGLVPSIYGPSADEPWT